MPSAISFCSLCNGSEFGRTRSAQLALQAHNGQEVRSEQIATGGFGFPLHASPAARPGP